MSQNFRGKRSFLENIFGFYKTRHILLSNSANCTVLRAVVLTQYRRVKDGRTGGRTDGIAVANTALAMRALRRAVKWKLLLLLCFVLFVSHCRGLRAMGDGGGAHWLVRLEWRPAGWSVCLRRFISPCTMKSRSSLLAPVHPGGPGKKGPGDFVLDGDPVPLPKKGAEPLPNFRQISTEPKRLDAS